jgi:hypothetical protein
VAAITLLSRASRRVRSLLPSTGERERVVARRADIEAEWSHGGAWLTSFVLPPTAVADAVSSVAGQMDLPFLVPVSATGGAPHRPMCHASQTPVTEPDDLINARCAALRTGRHRHDSNDDQPAKQFGDIKMEAHFKGSVARSSVVRGR